MTNCWFWVCQRLFLNRQNQQRSAEVHSLTWPNLVYIFYAHTQKCMLCHDPYQLDLYQRWCFFWMLKSIQRSSENTFLASHSIPLCWSKSQTAANQRKNIPVLLNTKNLQFRLVNLTSAIMIITLNGTSWKL